MGSGDAKNTADSNSNGKWEDGIYNVTEDDKVEPYKHGEKTDNKGILKDSDNGMYGSACWKGKSKLGYS